MAVRFRKSACYASSALLPDFLQKSTFSRMEHLKIPYPTSAVILLTTVSKHTFE